MAAHRERSAIDCRVLHGPQQPTYLKEMKRVSALSQPSRERQIALMEGTEDRGVEHTKKLAAREDFQQMIRDYRHAPK